MTIVEFFEKSPFENMISCLATKPDKVIFLGDENEMKKTISLYRSFLAKKRGGYEKIIIEPKHINKHDLKNIVQTITNIIKTEKDCVFDITGGEDLLILGCGIVFEKYREQYPFKLQRFDLENGKIIDCDCDNEVSFSGVFSVTVKEMISLHGGIIAPEDPQPAMNADKRDVDMLWDMACDNLETWNASVAFLKEFEKRTQPGYNKININIDLRTVKSEVLGFGRKLTMYSKFIRKLSKLGAISDLEITNNRISYNYKNSIVRRCLDSPGNILETKVFFEARNLLENGKPFFDNCYINVNIDWDGVVKHSCDTENEIDVILMRAMTPVFISCKMGGIEEVEPYKLWTVAERFGGKQVKKVLIASDFNNEYKKSKQAFINRAKDMNITFLPNAAQMSHDDWKNFLKEILSNKN